MGASNLRKPSQSWFQNSGLHPEGESSLSLSHYALTTYSGESEQSSLYSWLHIYVPVLCTTLVSLVYLLCILCLHSTSTTKTHFFFFSFFALLGWEHHLWLVRDGVQLPYCSCAVASSKWAGGRDLRECVLDARRKTLGPKSGWETNSPRGGNIMQNEKKEKRNWREERQWKWKSTQQNDFWVVKLNSVGMEDNIVLKLKRCTTKVAELEKNLHVKSVTAGLSCLLLNKSKHVSGKNHWSLFHFI